METKEFAEKLRKIEKLATAIEQTKHLRLTGRKEQRHRQITFRTEAARLWTLELTALYAELESAFQQEKEIQALGESPLSMTEGEYRLYLEEQERRGK